MSKSYMTFNRIKDIYVKASVTYWPKGAAIVIRDGDHILPTLEMDDIKETGQALVDKIKSELISMTGGIDWQQGSILQLGLGDNAEVREVNFSARVTVKGEILPS